jgi:hypothetical protein
MFDSISSLNFAGILDELKLSKSSFKNFNLLKGVG